MTEIDPTTITPRLSRIDKLMNDLEMGPPLSSAPSNLEIERSQQVYDDARQLILDLLHMSDKPVGETLYQSYCDKITKRFSSDEDIGSLPDAIAFARRWTPEFCPANEQGQVPIMRAMMESVIAAADHHLAKDGTVVSLG